MLYEVITYVRALARDLGDALGCGAHLVALRRTHSGTFDVERALPLAHAERLEGLHVGLQHRTALRILHPRRSYNFV